MAKSRKATATDADICMKLYELRREAEMRKARNFVNFQFHSQGVNDVLELMQATGTKERLGTAGFFLLGECGLSRPERYCPPRSFLRVEWRDGICLRQIQAFPEGIAAKDGKSRFFGWRGEGREQLARDAQAGGYDPETAG